jgi:RHS repeat-associated protein
LCRCFSFLSPLTFFDKCLCAGGYAGSNYTFLTQKERGNETGLDYFGARYYASVQGRFTSYDPVFVTALRLVDPQRLNLYSYARNNPLKFVDPDGNDIVITAKNEDDAKKRYNAYLLGFKEADRTHVHFFVGNGKHQEL